MALGCFSPQAPAESWRPRRSGDKPGPFPKKNPPAGSDLTHDGTNDMRRGLTGMRNVPSPDVLRVMERSRFEAVLRVLTAISVLALLSYVLFGPSI